MASAAAHELKVEKISRMQGVVVVGSRSLWFLAEGLALRTGGCGPTVKLVVWVVYHLDSTSSKMCNCASFSSFMTSPV